MCISPPESPIQASSRRPGHCHGLTIALLVIVFVTRESSFLSSIACGALLGLRPSLSVFFAKGAWATWDAPFVVPTGVANGVILGVVVRWLTRHTPNQTTLA